MHRAARRVRNLDRHRAIIYIATSRGGARKQQVKKPLPFIARHGVWTDEQRRQADDLKRRVEKDNLKLVRLVWADPHGAARAKAVTVPVFRAALETGYNINVATTTLDSANARTFASFTRGGGMGLDEMTGSPNLTIVPDPATFRVLPLRAASAGCCAMNISTAGCRSISRPGNCCASTSSGSRTRVWTSSWVWKSSGTSCASRKQSWAMRMSASPACAGGRSRLCRSNRAFPITAKPTWT